MPLVKNTKDLETFCKHAAKSDFVTVDTEFMSEKTYWPKLCLIQMATKDRAVAVDPLEPDLDLTPFVKLLTNKKVLKVLHGCRQDMMIFYHLFKALPDPVFDTQIAAMVCGFGESVGYQRLAKEIAKVDIEKQAQFTDWSRRPLSQKQIDYALSDVVHLRPVYEYLAAEIKREKRTSWIEEDMDILENPATYQVDFDRCWERIKLRNPKPKVANTLKHLAAWREQTVQEQNIPRNRLIKDDAMVELAIQRPKTKEDLKRLRAFPKQMANNKYTSGLMQALQAAYDTPKEKWPKIETPRRNKNAGNTTAIKDLLRVLLKHKADQHHVAGSLIATTKDLDAIAAEDKPDVAAMHGWRFKLFGKDAMDLKNGKIGVKLNHNEIEFIAL